MNDDMEDESQGFDIITYVVATNHAIDVMIDDVVETNRCDLHAGEIIACHYYSCRQPHDQSEGSTGWPSKPDEIPR
jgi:hypothetical protein